MRSAGLNATDVSATQLAEIFLFCFYFSTQKQNPKDFAVFEETPRPLI